LPVFFFFSTGSEMDWVGVLLDLEALLRRRLASSLRSFSSLARCRISLAYSAASALLLSARFFFRATRKRLRWRRRGVTRRWILGALVRSFLPSFSLSGRRTTYCRTSSSFVRLKSLRMWLARLGPSRRGTVLSVSPSISPSPFLTTTKAKTLMVASTMQPWTDFRLRSPVRRGR